jgi:membrane protease YdiL (CAAX protease family)
VAVSSELAPFPPDRTVPPLRDMMRATLVFEGGMLLLALLAAWWFSLPWVHTLSASWVDVCWGVLGALPSVALIPWSLRTTWGPAARMRRLLLEEVGPDLVMGAPWTLLFFSLGAGVCEEALFRGVVQDGLLTWMGVLPAIGLSSLLFGVCHPASRDYVVVAAMIGAWWGGLYVLSGTLTVPIVAHTLHDVAAMWALRRELAEA